MLDFAPTHDKPLIVDLFCGGGGASEGIRDALGRDPDVAINHNPEAIALHTANHPGTYHFNCNVWDVDPINVSKNQKVGLLWASPDCKHFSRAKGDKPLDQNIRSLAWVVVDWAEQTRPDVIIMENVVEFQTWGPLGPDNKPIKEFEGFTYRRFLKRLRKCGYRIETRELQGCDYGAPTIRKRWFLVARRDGRPIVWPAPSHGDPKSEAVKNGTLKPYRTVADFVDWKEPVPSIFATKQEIKDTLGLTVKRPLVPNTLRRIAAGLLKYTIKSENPFVLPLDEEGNAQAPSITKFNTGSIGHGVDQPLCTVTANSHHKRPGGAAPIGMISANMLSLKGTARRDSDITQPHPTVLAGGGHSAAIVSTMIQTGYGERKGQAPRTLDLNKPLGTVVAGGVKHAIVGANVQRFGYMAQHNTGVIGRSAKEPISAITQTGSHQTPVVSTAVDPAAGLTPQQVERARAVADFLRAYSDWDDGKYVTITVKGVSYIMVDVGMRMLTPRELFLAQGFPKDYVISEAMIDGVLKKFTKATQVSCAGNAVNKQVAEALALANCAHLATDALAINHEEKEVSVA